MTEPLQSAFHGNLNNSRQLFSSWIGAFIVYLELQGIVERQVKWKFFCANSNVCNMIQYFRRIYSIIWPTSRESVSSGIVEQVRFKPVCSATEACWKFETLDLASIRIILSKQRTIKVLIRLRWCAGWSAPLLFANGITHVFAWSGPYNQQY